MGFRFKVVADVPNQPHLFNIYADDEQKGIAVEDDWGNIHFPVKREDETTRMMCLGERMDVQNYLNLHDGYVRGAKE